MSLHKKLISNETWRKVDFFSSFHSPSEGRIPVTKDDIIPLMLVSILGLVDCIIAFLLLLILISFLSTPIAIILAILIMTILIRITKFFITKLAGQNGYERKENKERDRGRG